MTGRSIAHQGPALPPMAVKNLSFSYCSCDVCVCVRGEARLQVPQPPWEGQLQCDIIKQQICCDRTARSDGAEDMAMTLKVVFRHKHDINVNE